MGLSTGFSTIGKFKVENNLLGGSEDAQAGWIRQHGIDTASCADAPDSASCQKAVNERGAVGLALATGSSSTATGRCSGHVGTGCRCECRYRLSS